MFKFNLEFLSFIKKFVYIKLLLFCLFWVLILYISVKKHYDFFPLFSFEYFYNRFAVSWLENNCVKSYFLDEQAPKYLILVNQRIFTHVIFPEFFLIFLISCVLIFIACSNHMLSYLNFQKLIKWIIFGLFFEIWILLQLRGKYNWLTTYKNDQFIFGKWIIFVKVFICIIVICIFFIMLDYFLYEPLSFELPILILICMTGMFILVSSNDLFISYLALEIQSLSLYILAAWKQDNVKSIEAGLKYFFLGSFASGLILFGISIIYCFLGTTSYTDIYILLLHMYNNDLYVLGLYFSFLLILVGIFFKLGLAPFHYWLIDVYHGSPIIIVYIFSILPKISIIVFLIRFFSFIFSYHFMAYNNFSYYFLSLIIFCSLLSIFIGSIGAMYQITFKKLLAYSSIANMGYILLGFCTASALGYIASIYYLFIYLLMSINLFSIILMIRRFPYCSKIVNLVDLASISHSNFILSLLLALCLLSLAGIPPLVGFFGKFLIISALIAKEYYLLAIYAVCFSVLTCIYYIRLIRFLLFIDYDKFPIFYIAPLSYRSSLFISFISLLNIFFFFFKVIY